MEKIYTIPVNEAFDACMEDKNKGIVIGSIDYKEKSKIVYLYTPNGKESVLAGGAKSIKGGMLGFTNTLNYVEYVKTQSNLPKLVEYNKEEAEVVFEVSCTK